MTTTTFKIQFSEENIRKIRINLTEYNFTSFTALLKEHYQRFLLDQDFVLQYLDEDNDLISVDTEIEWEEMTNGKQSISISLKINNPRDFNEESDEDDIDLHEVIDALRSMFSSACKRQSNRGTCSILQNRRMFWHCFQTGYSLMEKGDQESLLSAKEYFLRALDFIPRHPTATYNIACVESLLGDIDGAVNTLKVAINYGWNNVEHLIEDPDLENIRETDGFDECVRFLSGEEIETPETETVEIAEPEKVEIAETEKVEIEIEPEVATVDEVTPEVSPEITSVLESENPVNDLSLKLSEMGIVIDEEKLLELSNKFGNDIPQIIHSYFRTLRY